MVDNVNQLECPVEPKPESDVLERLHALMHLYKRRMHAAARDGASGLAPMEARALRFFARHPDTTQRDLAQHALRDKSQIARLVSPLLERGLLEATADPTDRRVQRLRLTPAGKALQHKLQQHRQQFEAALVASLSASQHQALLSCLDKMLAAAEAE